MGQGGHLDVLILILSQDLFILKKWLLHFYHVWKAFIIFLAKFLFFQKRSFL